MNSIAERQLPPSDRTETESPAEKSNSVHAMNNALTHRIPGDTVNKATAELPDNQRSAIRKLHALYTDEAWSQGDMEEETGINRAVISQVFRGTYNVKSLDGVVAKIERYFALREQRSNSRKLPFIKTTLAKRMWDVCETALEFQRIAFIFGDSQIGKSSSLRQYRDDHNHGSTVYVEVPTGGNLLNFLAKLAEKIRVSPHQRRMDLRRRIIDSFDDRMLLIVDEAHRCIPEDGYVSSRAIQTIEFIRELHDEAGCGVVICATNVFRDEMEKGQVGKLLAQTKRRRVCALQLPNSPSSADLNTFAHAYGLAPATGEALKLQTRMISEEALGMWLTLLRMAAKVAKAVDAEMEWAHVITAYAGLRKLEGNA